MRTFTNVMKKNTQLLARIEKIPIKDLRNNVGQLQDLGVPANPRRIDKHKFNKLKTSLFDKDLNEIKELLVIPHNDTYVVLSGNMRLKAYKELDYRHIKCKVIDPEVDPQTLQKIIIVENTNYGSWDDDLLLNLFDAQNLLDWGVELPELDIDLIPEETQGDDDVPESAPAITVKGDLYILGEHRLLCGDSTMIDDVEKLMDGQKADMVFTSPPYNGDTHLDYGNGDNKKLYENNTDKWTSQEYIDFCYDVLKNLFIKTDGFIFWNVMYNAKSRFEYIKCIEPFAEKLWETIGWKKTGMPLSNGLTRNFEFIFCFKNGERKHLSEEFKTESNHWDISNIGSQDKKNHRACFPVELPEKGIELGSEANQIILEPFCGSGSTLIACEKTKRKCYGMELDEKYCDVIVKRYIEFCVKNNKEAKVYRNGELISNEVFLV